MLTDFVCAVMTAALFSQRRPNLGSQYWKCMSTSVDLRLHVNEKATEDTCVVLCELKRLQRLDFDAHLGGNFVYEEAVTNRDLPLLEKLVIANFGYLVMTLELPKASAAVY